MENENVNVQENQVNNGTQQTAAVAEQPQQPVVVVQTVAAPDEKKESWLKRHWKAVAAGAAALGTAVATTVVAYKKGKAVGIASVPMPEPEDYSLNPNE